MPALRSPDLSEGAPTTRVQARSARAIRRQTFLLLLAALVVLWPSLSGLRTALAQIEDGATLTVLRGQVAVLHGDGSAVQPAASGSVVQSGDEIRTLPGSGATITFFSGTEVELGEETILVVERVSRAGGRIDISLRQVFGASLHRVQTLTDAGSSYRVEVGGAVAVVRGTTFLIYGPNDENVVGIACTADCTPQTTFAGCTMGPNVAYWVETDRRQVVSACQPFNPRGNIWNAPGELRLNRR
ncbi:MAG: FecR domain-containing protein [Chloroflexi bacterium]|nr:FecR domain-containing protein [Chloroflexota bacterium]